MEMAPSPIVQELLTVPYLFNLLAVVLSVMPFLLVSMTPMTAEVNRYFNIRSFIMSALLNFTLVCHILFVKEKNEHVDSLYVAIMGMIMGAASTYVWLLHRIVVHRSLWARFWMVIIKGALICASAFILREIQMELFLSKDRGFGLAIAVLAIIVAVVLNGYPLIKASLSGTRVEPDVPVDLYGFIMCGLNTFDTGFFLLYAWCVGTIGSLLSIVSGITAIFGVFQLIVFLRSLLTALVTKCGGFYCFLVACAGATLCCYVLWVAMN